MNSPLIYCVCGTEFGVFLNHFSDSSVSFAIVSDDRSRLLDFLSSLAFPSSFAFAFFSSGETVLFDLNHRCLAMWMSTLAHSKGESFLSKPSALNCHGVYSLGVWKRFVRAASESNPEEIISRRISDKRCLFLLSRLLELLASLLGAAREEPSLDFLRPERGAP